MADEAALIDLARAEGFVLGPLTIRPAILEVASGERRETLEPRIMQVFVALYRRRGEVVSRDDLITQCWDGRSVGDDAITRCIARLRRLAEAEGGFAIETIPRVGYRLKEALFDGASAAVPVAIPPLPEDAPPRDAAVRPAPPWWHTRRAILTAVGCLAMALAAFAWLAWPAPVLNRVAVLPLQPLGSAEDARVFSAAVAEQIVGVLSDNQVQAVARSELASLRGPGRDEAARKLGAEFLLDGTVQHTPEGLRVIVHLDRISSHATLWTGSFDQSGTNPVSLQSQVAARVVDEIKGALQAASLKDDAAIAAFLKAKEYGREGGPTATSLRHDQMRIVVARAPDFSLGHSGLAWSSASLVQFSNPADVAALRAEARREAARALELNPKNGEAYLAEAALSPPQDFGEWERLYRQGLAVEPDEPTLNSSLAFLMEDVGRLSEALSHQERAAMLDPLSPRKNASLAAIQAITGNSARARATITRVVKVWPANTNAWGVRFLVESQDDPAKAQAWLRQDRHLSAALEPDLFAALAAYLDARINDTPQTRAAAKQALLTAVINRHLGDSATIEFLARLGDIDTAFAVAQTSFLEANRSNRRPDTAVLLRPATAALRRDARFLPLVERIGLVRYWQTHTAPDFCRTEAVAVCQMLQRGAANRPH